MGSLGLVLGLGRWVHVTPCAPWLRAFSCELGVVCGL